MRAVSRLLLVGTLAAAPPCFAASDGAPEGAQLLQGAVLRELLPALSAADLAGLGAEAASAVSWLGERGAAYLRYGARGWELSDGQGRARAVSPALSASLRSADRYFGLAEANARRPVTHAELEAGALSARSVEEAAALFEKSVADMIMTPTGPVVMEFGGEATLEGELRLRDTPEPTRKTMLALAEAGLDAERIARLFERFPDEMAAIDSAKTLAGALSHFPAMRARGVSKEVQDKVLASALDTALRNASAAYVFDPKAQLASIISSGDWSGRYVGFWHLHPPRRLAGSWGPADGPSFPDMEIAKEHGQSLVLVFDPAGFDLYDLSPLAGREPDLSKILKISHRSEKWRRRFQKLFERRFPRSAT